MNDTIPDSRNDELLVELTADVVSAYVGNNPVSTTELPVLISEVHKALRGVAAIAAAPPAPELKPAVNPKKSVFRDYIVCLEDGKKFKSLKRHLRSHFDMSPEEYREKWGLAPDYPMVAPAYSERRSALAKEKGLGRKKGARK
ncbi:MucR family transcriptional regulator [Salaquimonas pukyongi]|uniref:MucR family transcriptional regulator n=1 Tax=Salaquimonas pukyongi TaxID=2712698 RepID=UPI00096BA437|nr:MucR family transcriptional regulator [Salaquimonas pukyongi]